MTQARSVIVDTKITRWYHCVSRCVRKAFLLSKKEGFDRKAWIDERLKLLDGIFGVSVAGFSVMDNHLHVLLRIEVDEVEAWSAMEVVERWLRICPPRVARKPVSVTRQETEALAQDTEWIAEMRSRLGSISWFMKYLKEPLSRLINKEEDCSGTLFEKRFQSIALLDEESILATATYIDLNPLAANVVIYPEDALHTSIKERVDHLLAEGRLKDVQQIRNGSVPAQQVSEGLEDDFWLIPIENRKQQGAKRVGIKEGFTLGQYLQLVDYTSRLVREGKNSVAADAPPLLERLSIPPDRWGRRLLNLVEKPKLIGSFMASTPSRLREVAEKLGRKRLISTA